MMLKYPQLETRALSQFPVYKHRRLRTIVNLARDGSVVKLADPGAETVEWQLKYIGLSDAELAALQQFFAEAEGTLNSFTFLDPTGNLLAWTEDLSNPVWESGPFLAKTSDGADLVGGNGAWHVENAAAGTQELSQTLTAPGGYTYCLSVYAKATGPIRVTMLLGDNRYQRNVGTEWERISCTGAGAETEWAIKFGIELDPGAAVNLYGWQTEPQASPSLYKRGKSGAVYENARLRDDALTFTTTGVNSHSATVNITHASHL